MSTNIAAKFYTENVRVRYSEMDYKLTIKPSALLNFLQDIASENAEYLGFGYSYIQPKNLAWFLLKYRMEFDEYPTGVYDLTIKTEPRGYNKLFAFRDFEIFDGDKRLGRIASTWSMIDLETKKFVLPQSMENPNFLALERRDNDLSYSKIPSLEKTDIQQNFEIRYDDIDVNSHVNNANYIIWAFEPLPFDFRSSRKLKTLDVVYKKEIKYGENVVSEIDFRDENTTVHIIKNASTGEDLCHLQACWEVSK